MTSRNFYRSANLAIRAARGYVRASGFASGKPENESIFRLSLSRCRDHERLSALLDRCGGDAERVPKRVFKKLI
jgi:hypothetical protein